MATDEKIINRDTDEEEFIDTANIEYIDYAMSEDIVMSEDIMKSDERKEISSSKDFIRMETDSYIRIDKEFERFLANFVKSQNEKEKQKLHFKDQFFWLIMIGFFSLMILPLIIVISSSRISDTSMIVALISTLIELVSAIIVLPRIIAEYLFNKEEDKNMIEIIKSMQEYNEKKHLYIENNNKKL